MLPRIAVLATGGTIAGAAPDATNTAGYQAGALGLASLLDAVPALARVAQIEGEQVASIDSKDLEPALWATLVQRIEALAADPAHRRHRDHARHRHAGGNRRAAASVRGDPQAGGDHGGDAPGHRALAGWPAEPAERGDGRGQRGCARPRRAGGVQQQDPCRARRGEDQHLCRRRVPVAGDRGARLGAGRPRGVRARHRARCGQRAALQHRRLAGGGDRQQLRGGFAHRRRCAGGRWREGHRGGGHRQRFDPCHAAGCARRRRRAAAWRWCAPRASARGT